MLLRPRARRPSRREIVRRSAARLPHLRPPVFSSLLTISSVQRKRKSEPKSQVAGMLASALAPAECRATFLIQSCSKPLRDGLPLSPTPGLDRLSLQPRIDRLALQREDAEHALVHAPERLALHEALEAFDPQRELAQRQRPLPRQPALAQPLEVLGQRVLRPVDDPQVLAPAALDRRLQQATRARRDERQRLDDRALAAASRSGWSTRRLPPPRSRDRRGRRPDTACASAGHRPRSTKLPIVVMCQT